MFVENFYKSLQFCPDLFDIHESEVVRTMKIRLLYRYRIPRQEVWFLKKIAAFVEIGPYASAVQGIYVVEKKGRVWDCKCGLPAALSDFLFKRALSEGGPPLYCIKYFLWSALASLSLRAGTDKQASCTVALNIVVYSVTGRHGEEFHAGIFPYRSVDILSS